ncbi:DHA2 family efflux MFS transporter permease subunit [Microbispora catharanthi]|uniref:DHA2 family efflux MFS transporter permease subunit n=2 Tax=Microbispora catharanthi TaxID=1712871 RepID=A0A5N6BJN1_9ACTN|nr:DHA2 family efflux MFS transporter permease subunit [Microbispora catharanthi]
MTHREILEALSGLMLGMFVAILSSTVVSNALPTITAELHADETTYTWVITATLLAATVSTPIWGKLSDLFSKKLLIQLGLIVYVIGSAIAGLSQNPSMLITARVVQGLGVGGLTALAQVIMAAMISPRERGRYSGYLGAVFAVATIGGPLIGGLIVDTSWLGWRWCFYVGVPFAILSLIVLQKTLHLPVVKRDVRIDWGGAVLIAAAVSLLLIWVSFAGNKYDWLSWQTGAMVGGAVVLAVLFLVVESKVSEPIVPLRLFRIRTVSLSVVASVLVGVAMFGGTTFLSQYFQLARGETPTVAGLMTLPMILGLAISSTVSGQIITRTGHWKVFLVSGTFFLTAGFALMGTLRYDTDYWLVAIFMFCVGVGIGMSQQNLVLAVQNQVRAEDLGAGSSVVSFFRSLGGAIGVSALGALMGDRVKRYLADALAALGVHGTGQESGAIPKLSALPAPIRTAVESAYGHGIGDLFLYAAPLTLLALIAVLFIKEVPLRTSAITVSADTQETDETLDPEIARQRNGAVTGRHAQRDRQQRDGQRPIMAEAEFASPNGHSATQPLNAQPLNPQPLNAQVLTATQAQPYAALAMETHEPGGVSISGFVKGQDGAPVGRATLTLIDVRGHQLGRTVTRDDGGYALQTPGGGTYVLIASAGDREPQVATLVVGDQPVDFDMVLAASGRLVGTVRGIDGTPVAEAVVVVTDVRGEVVATSSTDTEGGFSFSGIVAGTYTLTVSGAAYRPAAVPIEVLGTGQTRHDVVLLPGARVRGTVRVKDGVPLADARVTLLDAAGNVVGVATTGEDGEYAFTDLTGGQYTIVASGYPPVASTLNLGGQGDEPYDVWLGHER